MNIEDFPNLDEVEKAISILKKKNFPKFDKNIGLENYVTNITNIITSEFGFIPNIKKPILLTEGITEFYRVREYSSVTNINSTKEYSYPPIKLAGIGRCNFPNHPVFYCSDDAGIALTEVVREHNKVENKYIISKWEVIPKNETYFLESFILTKLNDVNMFTALKDDLIKGINNPFISEYGRGLNPDQERGLIGIIEYLTDSFMNDKDYSISASLAHRSLYDIPKRRTGMLIYPSIQSNRKGVNFAMHPDFVDSNLKLTKLYNVSISDLDVDKGTFNIGLIECADVNKESVEWKKIDIKDSNCTESLKNDLGINLK